MKRLLALVALFFASPALSMTYYVDCTAPDDRAPATSPADAWRTIDKVNRSSFSPGDFILFKRGCTWHQQLTVPSSGTEGNPITFGAYGTGALPIIDANDVLNEVWARDVNNANLWWASLASDPNSLIIDGNFGVKKSVASMDAPYHWAYDKGVTRLWLRSADDPGSHVIEYGKRASAVYANGESNLGFRDLDLRGGTWKTAQIENSAGGVTFDGVTVKFSGRDAISLNYDGGLTDGVTVRNCTIGPANASGVWIEEAKNILIEKSTISNIGIDDALDYTNGVQIFGRTCSTITIQENHVYNCGRIRSEQVATGFHGGGIHLDSPGAGVIVRRNLVHNAAAANARGIHFEIVSDGLVEYNVVYDVAGEGISQTTWGTDTYSRNKIHNNTVHGCGVGIMSQGAFPEYADSVTDCLVENNILTGNARQLCARWGAENDGIHGSGNVYEYNCLGAEAANFIEWGFAVYKSTYAAFAANYGSATHSVTSDPRFTNAAGRDFTLQPGSACIDAGANLTAGYSTALMPTASWPDHVMTGDQSDAGPGWAVGAYLFPVGDVGRTTDGYIPRRVLGRGK